ncbi:F-box/kelch-repeat protein At1g22040-like [Andrographis paniculata]|uniref:F-box/kelch-repeat protein At1g22040-like n=1 Tax=Andrographis paniculata TaxID=175694 RepID=UPI0021E734B4|nr:F-box/kelch-repeat protein At1g22040-like [Andrographis paniculata]XP_051137608.1 F-box/kelch-repeat protein At1g22040-like [Andrographis paniculata]XP_051137616.1 F-box/kelch-repeat protein At1g22040-like [Andrographis paniculata]
MGARMSMNNQSCNEFFDASQSEARKRQRTSSSSLWDETARLIPYLPDEISIQILARLPRICHFNAKLVSRTWRAALTSKEVYQVRKELGKTEAWLYVLTKLSGEKLVWHALDPVNGAWLQLPPMPSIDGFRRGLRLWNMVGSSIIGDTLRSWIRRRDASDNIPYCGCAIGAVDGCLYVVGGFFRASAMKSVWRFDPILNSWSEVAPMSVGRGYCKIGVLNNKLYVVGGVTWDPVGLTPLQSAEMYDPCTDTWTKLPSMPFLKAQVLPTGFLSDLLKPMATGLTSYAGKLYVPQSLYCWPFFVDVGGEVFDPVMNTWNEMPDGMAEGWPARQAGTKLSVVVDEALYALDPSGSPDRVRIKVYDNGEDAWKTVGVDVPMRDIGDSDSPYLLTDCFGKLHVIAKDVNRNIVVVQADWRNQYGSGPSTSSGSFGDHLVNGLASSEEVWKVIATKNIGSSELVSCQILEI